MKIGGSARWYAEVKTPDDVEEAAAFAHEKNIPLIVLGGGSNTVFTDDVIEALVVRITADRTKIGGQDIVVESGKCLATLLLECAAADLDLSALTGIPGSIGGAVFGNAGQGPKGIWIGNFVTAVTAYVDGKWKTFTKKECDFQYRESFFKNATPHPNPLPRGEGKRIPPIIWEVALHVPSRPKDEVLADVERLLKKRIETQPHLKTAGSCFKAVHNVPAWQLIDAAGLRGKKIGDVEIAEKHANFLLNTGKATYDDAKKLVEFVRRKIPKQLEVEMRFVEKDGSIFF